MADTKGRTRAAKRRAVERMRESVMQDEEVEFNPIYEDDISHFNRFQNHTSNDGASTPRSTGAADTTARSSVASQSSRIDALEQDFTQVKTKVNSIDAKLDMLIAAANPIPVSSTPARPRPQPAGPGEDRLPPPRQLRLESDRDGYVERILQEERFSTQPTEGKAKFTSDIFRRS